MNGLFFLFATTLFTCQEGFGQMKFNVKLIFPQSLNKDKIAILVDNGKGSKKVNFELHERQVLLSDTFYSKFAAIEIRYANDENVFQAFYAGFFVSEKPAFINFIQNNPGKNPLGNYRIKNALDMDNEDDRQYKNFIVNEDNDFWNYYKANYKKIGENDSIITIIQAKADILLNKKTEFFKRCSGSYYCLWLFKTEVAVNNTISSDSLLTIYNNAFSVSMKKSFEGDEIVKIIQGRSEKRNMPAPNFIATDVNGNRVSLDQFRDSYVLIDFWASWCVPCVKKTPDLKEIRKKYSEEKLKIIFITEDKNRTAFNNAVDQYKIDFGIHLFATDDLINQYGAQAIPKTFLIDHNGVIIYNSQLEKHSDSNSLILNQILKEKLQ